MSPNTLASQKSWRHILVCLEGASGDAAFMAKVLGEIARAGSINSLHPTRHSCRHQKIVLTDTSSASKISVQSALLKAPFQLYGVLKDSADPAQQAAWRKFLAPE